MMYPFQPSADVQNHKLNDPVCQLFCSILQHTQQLEAAF